VFFPLTLLLLLTAYIKGIIISLVAGFLLGPMVIISKIEHFKNIVGAILCPVFMVVGAVTALFGWLGYGVYLAYRFLVEYWLVVALSLCGPGNEGEL